MSVLTEDELIDKLLDDAKLCLKSGMTDIRLPDIGRRILDLIEARTGEIEYRINSDNGALSGLPMKDLDAAIFRRNELECRDSGTLHIEMRRVHREPWVRLKRG